MRTSAAAVTRTSTFADIGSGAGCATIRPSRRSRAVVNELSAAAGVPSPVGPSAAVARRALGRCGTSSARISISAATPTWAHHQCRGAKARSYPRDERQDAEVVAFAQVRVARGRAPRPPGTGSSVSSAPPTAPAASGGPAGVRDGHRMIEHPCVGHGRPRACRARRRSRWRAPHPQRARGGHGEDREERAGQREPGEQGQDVVEEPQDCGRPGGERAQRCGQVRSERGQAVDDPAPPATAGPRAEYGLPDEQGPDRVAGRPAGDGQCSARAVRRSSTRTRAAPPPRSTTRQPSRSRSRPR